MPKKNYLVDIVLLACVINTQGVRGDSVFKQAQITSPVLKQNSQFQVLSIS